MQIYEISSPQFGLQNPRKIHVITDVLWRSYSWLARFAGDVVELVLACQTLFLLVDLSVGS